MSEIVNRFVGDYLRPDEGTAIVLAYELGTVPAEVLAVAIYRELLIDGHGRRARLVGFEGPIDGPKIEDAVRGSRARHGIRRVCFVVIATKDALFHDLADRLQDELSPERMPVFRISAQAGLSLAGNVVARG